MTYKLLRSDSDGHPIKAWIEGVPVEDGALKQLKQLASLPFIHEHIAAMPDIHVGVGSTVGSVIPTLGAIIPAAVGVDIGCGMMAVRTTLKADDLPDNLSKVRSAIEAAVPHGRTTGRDKGAWGEVPDAADEAWSDLSQAFERLSKKHPVLKRSNHRVHLGTLGTGNHFIEVCLDESDRVWVMLHSGSRGVGNRIGTYFIELAKQDIKKHNVHLPDQNLAYFKEGSDHFDDYVEAVGWAQDFARENRELMMNATLSALRKSGLTKFRREEVAINCHHNYVNREHHFGKDVYLTRKGAVSAKRGELGIIPGSMGAASYIVRGKGNADSFCSCSHGAGRLMSRTEAKGRFTLAHHRAATAHVECRKDKDVIDETPGAYKPIEAVMAAQQDLVEVVHILRQVVCVKG